MKDYSFGEFLYKLRKRIGLSQFQLGGLLGVTDKAVSKWENDNSLPDLQLLFKLAQILEVTTDELLTCKYNPSYDEKQKGVFAMREDIWQKIQKSLKEKYGENQHIEISNRFLSEFSVLKNDDVIIYWDLISKINKLAESRGCYVRSWGEIGSSFVAYILGATEINPLRAHYYCPKCQKVEFFDTEYCGWDLADKKCSCGGTFIKDGCNIAFETVNSGFNRRSHFDLCVPEEIAQETESLIRKHFEENKILNVIIQPQSKVTSLLIINDNNSEAVDGSTITYEEKAEKFSHYPSFNILINPMLDAVGELSNVTGCAYKYMDYYNDEVLEQFKNNNTENVSEFGSERLKKIIDKYQPNSYGDLLKLNGLGHATVTDGKNAEVILSECDGLKNALAFREDVFDYIKIKCSNKGITDSGIPAKIMNDVKRGIYARKGMPDDIRKLLVSIECEDWFISSIQKIMYLFPKAHCAAILKEALLLMSYKVKFPEKFKIATEKYRKTEKE